MQNSMKYLNKSLTILFFLILILGCKKSEVKKDEVKTTKFRFSNEQIKYNFKLNKLVKTKDNLIFGEFEFNHNNKTSLNVPVYSLELKDKNFTSENAIRIIFPQYEIKVNNFWRQIREDYCAVGTELKQVLPNKSYVFIILLNPIVNKGSEGKIVLGKYRSEVFSIQELNKLLKP